MAFDENTPKPTTIADTDNATKFNAKDLEKQINGVPLNIIKKWKRFRGYNTGIYNGYWADQKKLRQMDNDYLFDAIAGYIELSPYQKRRAKMIFRGLPYSRWSPYYDVKTIAFIVCLLVANEDYRGDGMIYYPTKNYDHLDKLKHNLNYPHEPFEDMASRLDITSRKLEKGIPKFRSYLDRTYPEWRTRAG